MKNHLTNGLSKHSKRVMLLLTLFIFSKALAQTNSPLGDNLYADAQRLLYLSTLKGDNVYNEAIQFSEAYQLTANYQHEEIGSNYHYSITFISPFLSNFTFGPLILAKGISGSGNNFEQKKNAFFNNKIAKLDATNLASGMARFLAQRAQAELTESFFWSMQKKLERSPELQFFFPQTYQKLKDIKNLNLNLDIDILRNSFDGDISNFQDRVYNLTQESSVKGKRHLEHLHRFFTENSVGQFIGLGIETIGNSSEIDQPMILLSNFTKSNLANKLKNKSTSNYNLFSTVQFLEITPKLLSSPSSKGNILTEEELNSLISDEEFLKVYLALFLAKTRVIEKNQITNSTPDYHQFESTMHNRNNEMDTIKFVFSSMHKRDNENQYSENLKSKMSLESIVENHYKKNQNNRPIVELKSFISNLHNSIKILETKSNEEQAKVNKNFYRSTYNIAFNTVIETINQLNTFTPYTEEITTSIETFNIYSNSVLDVADSFRSKNYKHGIATLIQILNSAVPNMNDDDELLEDIDSKVAKDILKTYLEKGNNHKVLLKNRDFIEWQDLNKEEFYSQTENLDIHNIETIIDTHQDSLISLYQKNKEFRKFVRAYHAPYNDFVRKLNTYGNLFAAVALAESSDDIKAAIESTVLPTGSSRLKRTSNYSITVNAYVGAFAGRAFYKELNADGLQEKKEITTFGITAPIGISLNKGLIGSSNNPSTLSFTLQIIDLGSLVNFYIKKGDGAQLPNDTKIQLGDILAPGAQLSYSIGDTPFTVMAGMQYVPNLSRIEDTNTNFKPLTWRAQLGLTVDIPLFNLKVWQ